MTSTYKFSPGQNANTGSMMRWSSHFMLTLHTFVFFFTFWAADTAHFAFICRVRLRSALRYGSRVSAPLVGTMNTLSFLLLIFPCLLFTYACVCVRVCISLHNFVRIQKIAWQWKYVRFCSLIIVKSLRRFAAECNHYLWKCK